MRARIVKDSGGGYVGEVYGVWTSWIFETRWEGWRSVTTRCVTKWGARLELENWKKENCPDEFEI